MYVMFCFRFIDVVYGIPQYPPVKNYFASPVSCALKMDLFFRQQQSLFHRDSRHKTAKSVLRKTKLRKSKMNTEKKKKKKKHRRESRKWSDGNARRNATTPHYCAGNVKAKYIVGKRSRREEKTREEQRRKKSRKRALVTDSDSLIVIILQERARLTIASNPMREIAPSREFRPPEFHPRRGNKSIPFGATTIDLARFSNPLL